MSMRFALVALLMFCLPAYAAEFKPYPSAKITLEQWQSYYDEVRSSFGETLLVVEAQSLEIYRDEESGMQFAFTRPEHPAHPAWITRQPVEAEKSINLRTIGYFAGDELSFAKLFTRYLELNEKMMQEIHAESGDDSAETADEKNDVKNSPGTIENPVGP